MSRLLAVFDGLTAPRRRIDGVATFSGALIRGDSGRHIAKDADHRPSVLIGARGDPTTPHPATIALENLRVEHFVQCHISQPDGSSTIGRFTIVHCFSEERQLHEYFLRAMEAILDSLPVEPTEHEISTALSTLVELFHAIRRAPTGSAQGLWAELLLITQAGDPASMVEAWHRDAMERYDFSMGSHRIEVKASGDRHRRHHFSLEQAHPPAGTTALIASIFVERAANGTSLGALWDRARELVTHDPGLRLKIEQVCMTTLGNSWQDARRRCYDQRLAEESLAFFDVQQIPRPSEEQPLGVIDLRFRSDLGFVDPVDSDAYRGTGALFTACLGDKPSRSG